MSIRDELKELYTFRKHKMERDFITDILNTVERHTRKFFIGHSYIGRVCEEDLAQTLDSLEVKDGKDK